MTSPDGRQVRSPRTRDEHAPPPRTRKAVLFCPDCEYEDLVDGNWEERDDRTDRVRELVCPQCDAVVTGRPLPEDREAPLDYDDPGRDEQFDPWRRLWASTLRFWVKLPPNADSLRRAN
ncbi:hypothetical protein ACFR9U_18110 [Halorientalis brevis]|uniref:DUF8106 domain-containing protein n=1 Tax=Halorientalis brevis TaxID=1126241 RepID=A0ABD6CEU1_9EURY|nr:hypothetical protein [Halorientalis brevis]